MGGNFNQKLTNLLKKDARFVDEESGELVKNEIINEAYKIDKELITLLLEDKEIKSKFFTEIKEHWVFDINKFVQYIQDKNFLSDSYTKFKNKIGLNIDGKFLNERKEISLVWPFKDCVLEGGMTKEDEKKDEIFFNELLAQDEIDRLLEPKVLTNFKKYTSKGEEKVKDFTRNEKGTIKDNLIIKGNNLLALHSLKKEFAGKVKLIYIDPPYYFDDKKDSDSFAYNSNFKLSSWLTFMKNRLEVSRDLLREDGFIFVQITETGLSYLKVILDEIFKNNFLNQICVRAKTVAGASGGGEDKSLKKNVEFILFYAKNKDLIEYNNSSVEIPLFKLIKEKEISNKNYEYDQVLMELSNEKSRIGEIDSRNGKIQVFKHKNYLIKSVKQVAKDEKISTFEVYSRYLDKIFRTQDSQSSIRHKVTNLVKSQNDCIFSIEYIPDSGKNKGKKTQVLYYKSEQINFLSSTTKLIDGEIIKIRPLGALWDDIGWDGIANEGGVRLKNGKKPEKLLKRIIELCTNPMEIVLDYHLGSGTTCAVAHKLERQYIGIEQLDYEDNDSVVRLRNVVCGDLTGISKEVSWKGGKDFIYCELMKHNEEAIERIQDSKDAKQLLKIWNEMCDRYFLNYDVNIKKFNENKSEFEKLSLTQQKKILCEMLDKNQLYVNLSEIDDSDFKINKEDKELNKKFYS
ncbi:MAG TPA: site-specific DNA-methyltransferase [Candidatus Nanoarchaeia archaeon]|nr:site-specific DNA-methyltransferase [Candidatus Nanoarchaeia archaeon]